MAWNETDKLKERFSFLCSAKYGDMSATDDARVHHCAKCDTLVYEAASEAEFDSHAREGRCVSVVSLSGAKLVAVPDDPDDGERLPPPPMMGKVRPPEVILPLPPLPPLQRTTGKVKAPGLTPMARIKRWWRGLVSGD